MERFIATQTKTNEVFSESINQLNAKFDAMASHQKAIDNQIAQIAQQVSHLSRPHGHLPSQPETNPKGHVNAITSVGEGFEESPVMVLQEIASDPLSARVGEEREEDKGLGSTGTPSPSPPIRPYQVPAPYPQRLTWSQLLPLEPRFARFLDMLKRIHVSIPFLEALKEAPNYLRFLRELLFKNRELKEVSVPPTGEAYCAILQNGSPSKRNDPGSFSVPCCIGDLQIERALCDLGASVSLMPLSLCKKLQLTDLLPTPMTIQLADSTVRRPVGILEDVPVQVGKFVIPCDFMVLDMGDSSDVPIILGRPFLSTAGATIDVKAGSISFEICGKTMDFCLPSSPVLTPPIPPMPASHSVTTSRVEVSDGDGCPHIWPIAYTDPLQILSTPGAISADTEGLVEPVPPFYTPVSTPPESSLRSIWR